VREHLQQVAKTIGRPPPELIGPPFPDRFASLWDAFLDLSAGRGYNGMGPNPISWPDILAWDTLTRTGLQEWEVRAIKALDAVWLRVMREGSSDG
jgi:hypothetical protein